MIVILINHWFVLTCIYTNNNMTGVNITLKKIVGENLRNKVQICKNMAKKKVFKMNICEIYNFFLYLKPNKKGE